MSMAWEVTNDDIEQVLDKHGVPFTEEIADLVDADEVENAVLSYVNFDNQVQAALCEIEDQLLKQEVIKGEKKFDPPNDPDEWDNEDEFEEEE